MLTSAVTTDFFARLLLALTALERWQGARRFNSSNIMTQRWFIITGSVTILILTILYIVVTYNRFLKERKIANKLFVEYSKKRGLSRRERKILLEIAEFADVKRKESIFNLSTAFDRGADQLLKKSIEGGTTKRIEILKNELSFLREKLGFRKRPVTSAPSRRWKRSRRLDSRQIPVGGILHLTDTEHYDLLDIKCVVIKNDDTGIALKWDGPLRENMVRRWRVRYNNGSKICEFDTKMVEQDSDIFVLEHRSSMRLLNRRRFARAGFKRPAFLAHFPFEVKSMIKKGVDELKNKGFENKDVLKEVYSSGLKKPEFVPAMLTELGGPGLRMEVPFEAKVGDRVLVVFKMDERKELDLNAERDDRVKSAKTKIIEDIGEVRNVRPIENGFSIAVELTGLSDNEVDELVRVTNTVLVKAAGKDGNVLFSENAGQITVKTGAVEGV